MCSTSKMASLTISEKITIDGSNKDWPELTQFDTKSKLVYGVYNDDQFVYLFLKTADRMTQQKLLQGITVWYHPYFSKKKDVGIHYPFLPIRLSESLRREPDQEPDISILLRSLPREAELLNNESEKATILYLEEIKDDINVAIGFSNKTKEMLYELRIPLLYTFSEQFTNEMTFIIETNDMQRPNDGMRPEDDLGDMPTGGRRSGGGMGRQGMRDGTERGSRPDFDSISLRIYVNLDHSKK